MAFNFKSYPALFYLKLRNPSQEVGKNFEMNKPFCKEKQYSPRDGTLSCMGGFIHVINFNTTTLVIIGKTQFSRKKVLYKRKLTQHYPKG